MKNSHKITLSICIYGLISLNISYLINDFYFLKLIIILILGFFLSKKITNPINKAYKSMQRLIKKSSFFKENLSKHRDLFSSNQNIYQLSKTTDLVYDEIKNIDFDKYTEELENYYENSAKFISKLSHDLRTPLTLIKGYTKAISINKEKNLDKYLKNIENSVSDIENIIYNELDLSFDVKSKYFLEKKEIDLNNFINELKEDFKAVGENFNREIIFSKNKINGKAYLDKSSLKRVFENILNNAIKYSDDLIKINIINKNEFLKISIIDKGIGISEIDLDNINKIFYQGGNNKKEGYGLGLYISSSILKAHEYDYKIDSKKNKGTTFSIFIKKTKSEN
ncbi:MAG: sensor histidine kinase [Bacillota bacterium]